MGFSTEFSRGQDFSCRCILGGVLGYSCGWRRRRMYPILDDLKRSLLVLEEELHCTFCNEAELLQQQATRFCITQLLVHDRHCRRIYRTLCEFCKPQEVVIDVRKATAALWHAWRGIHTACGDAAADVVARLEDHSSGKNVNEEQKTIALLFSLLESDINGAREDLAVMERGLQQLRNDVERERMETLDAATQRRSLRRRQMQRAATVQQKLEDCCQTLRGEFTHMAGLMEKLRQLQENVDQQLAKELICPTSSHVKHENKNQFHDFYLTELQQFVLDIKAHEDAQADILSKTSRVRENMPHPRQTKKKHGVALTLESQIEKETDSCRGSAVRSMSDLAVSILQRAEDLLHCAYAEGGHRGNSGSGETSCMHDNVPNCNELPTSSIRSSTPWHTSEKNTLFPTPSLYFPTTREKKMRAYNDGHDNDASHTEYNGGSQRLERQQFEPAWIARHVRSEGTPKKSVLDFENACPSGCTTEWKHATSMATNSHHVRNEGAGRCTGVDQRYIKSDILKSTSSENSPSATVVLSSDCESHPMSEALLLAVNGHQALPHGERFYETKSQAFQGGELYNEEKRLLARSKALLVAQLSKLTHKVNSAYLPNNQPDTTSKFNAQGEEKPEQSP